MFFQPEFDEDDFTARSTHYGRLLVCALWTKNGQLTFSRKQLKSEIDGLVELLLDELELDPEGFVEATFPN